MHRLAFGGVEGGGTKFNCMIGTGPDDVLASTSFPTVGPRETLDQVVRFFDTYREQVSLAAVGYASFGPIDLEPGSPTYGYVTTTPKQGWSFTDIVGELRHRLDVPIAWETDVNAAAFGEYRWGAARGADPAVYITVGTGVGGGAFVNGEPVHGLIHPEMGHLVLPAIEGDDFPGTCPYHGRCLEGLVSGPAIAARAGRPGSEIAADDPIWDLVAGYLASAVANIMYVLAPQRLVLGGGVMEQRHLFPRIHRNVLTIANGYLHHPTLLQHIDTVIVPPALGPRSGVLGALAFGQLAVEQSQNASVEAARGS